MPTSEFEPATSASDRPQTIALDRSATGMVWLMLITILILNSECSVKRVIRPVTDRAPNIKHVSRNNNRQTNTRRKESEDRLHYITNVTNINMVKLRDVHGNNLLVNISISVQIASADVTLQG